MEENFQLFPYFQPILSVASGRIIGYEALARQYDQRQQAVSAGHLFSSPKMDTNERLELDRKVRRMALQKFAELDNGAYLSINISASWIDNIRQLNALPTLKMLEELNIDRQRIIIEITEAHVDISKLREIVKRYRQQGLRVALDDFGSGSSQLERVLAIHPDIIKIDLQLFKKTGKGGMAGDFVHMLTRLGKRTGCQIICEGVETEAEFLFGLSCGAQYMQGFLFSAAEPEFKAPTLYEKHINSLRAKFFRQTVNKVQKNIEVIGAIKKLIYRLKDALQGDFNLNELAKWNFTECRIIRFYLCDNDGMQISPNFNFTENRWFTDPRKIGFNWSWRPYFFQLIALENNGDSGRIVTSERYHDFDTNLLCKTLALRLDNERILLTDVIAGD
ncbi:MAG: EAL domain-containing protein [Methylomonas sp.]|jgi:EAL domain-containing protein (putative c-di-GMP-specific phosphodiesterase class I)